MVALIGRRCGFSLVQEGGARGPTEAVPFTGTGRAMKEVRGEKAGGGRIEGRE